MGLLLTACAAVTVGRRAGPLSGDVPAYRTLGPRRAPVVIEEFSDFQCPKCALAQSEFRSLLARYPEKTRAVFRHMPLKMHKWAPDAAKAAEAAGLQGKFWEFADRLYAEQKTWSESPDAPALFRQYAESLGLALDRFDADRASPRVAQRIEQDRQQADVAGIFATPTFFVNDRRIVGDVQLKSNGVRYVELELDPAR
jgi:protein-disulfide isomerase